MELLAFVQFIRRAIQLTSNDVVEIYVGYCWEQRSVGAGFNNMDT